MAGDVTAIVLDTHALLWWTLDPDMLSARATEICNEIDRSGAFISAISIWEIGIKIKRKKLDIGLDIKTYTDRLKRLNSVRIVPIDEDIWIRNLELDWDHRDPADRTIVATATIHDAVLLTKDDMIRKFYEKAIW